MAIIQPVIEEQLFGSTSPNGSARITWGPMTNGDVGYPARYHSHSDRSVQVVGTFGAGGNVAVQGSLDEVNFSTLNDPQGSPVNLTATSIRAMAEMSTVIRPAITAGDATTSLTVTMIMRRAP